MTDALKQALNALRRNAADETLVLLWHELEAARVAGDRRALRTIERLAAQVVREGDEGQQREAERLLETLGAAVPEHEAARPATAVFEGNVEHAGDHVESPDAVEGETKARGGVPIGTIVWLLVVIAIVILNLLGQGRN